MVSSYSIAVECKSYANNTILLWNNKMADKMAIGAQLNKFSPEFVFFQGILWNVCTALSI